MKKFLLITLPLAVFFVSCQKEQTSVADETIAGDYTFTACIEDGIKTELSSDLEVLWCEGDSISVFDEAGTNFKFVTSGSGKTATFSKVTEGEMQGSTFYAVYPYTKGTTISDGTVTFTTSNDYRVNAKSFTRATEALMMAKTTDNELHFKNVNALLKFEIPEDLPLKSILFYANGGDLAGEMKVKFNQDGYPIIDTKPTTTNGIIISALDNRTLTGTYYLPVVPGTYTNLRMMITYADDGTPKSSEAFSADGFTLERNEVSYLGTIYDGRPHYKWLTFENGKIPASHFDTSNTGVEYSVVDNPLKSTRNDSEKVLYMKRTADGSGYTKIYSSKIPNSSRKKITGIVFNYKPGTSTAGTTTTVTRVFPMVVLYVNDKSESRGPVKVNGITATDKIAGFKDAPYKEVMEQDNWNQLTFKASQFGLTSFDGISDFQIKVFLWQAGSNWDTRTDISAYIDNIGFCFD